MEKCEYHGLVEKRIDDLEESHNEVRLNLFGNGQMGTSQKADKAYSFMKNYENSKNGFYDWLFRAIILLILGYIATRVGLK